MTPRPGKTTVRHKPTGKTYVVETLSPTGIGLSGLLGSRRRVISREAFNNNEVWEVLHQ